MITAKLTWALMDFPVRYVRGGMSVGSGIRISFRLPINQKRTIWDPNISNWSMRIKWLTVYWSCSGIGMYCHPDVAKVEFQSAIRSRNRRWKRVTCVLVFVLIILGLRRICSRLPRLAIARQERLLGLLAAQCISCRHKFTANGMLTRLAIQHVGWWLVANLTFEIWSGTGYCDWM